MLEIRKSQERGRTHTQWLDSRHTFSFGDYRDPKQQGFSDLLVINDDIVQAGSGFGAHSHQEMEIFSYVLEGALAHKDSMGTGSVIYPGDVQIMSAGTGVQHSEFNHSQDKVVHFLQIWIVPNQKHLKPRYQQMNFSEKEKRGQLRLIISPDGKEGSLQIHQDVYIYAGLFNKDEKFTLELPANRYAYVQVARGDIKLNGHPLFAGDGVRIRKETTLTLSEGHDAEVLVFNLRRAQ